MMSLLGLLENVNKPLLLCPKLAEFIGNDKPMSLLEILMIIEQHVDRANNPNIIRLTVKTQQLFETSEKELTIDQFNRCFFKIIPMIILNYNDYYLIMNNNHYTWDDLQIDRKMFNIAVRIDGENSTSNTKKCVNVFKPLPIDIFNHIKSFLHNGIIPFCTPYHLSIYEATNNHDEKLLSFWKRI